jgi:geranylgeranyl pyrophosphate synthase
MIVKAIAKALHSATHNKALYKIMDYAVFPAGKLFRPRLVEALALDLDHHFSQNHLHLGAAIEIHHAYTLVHDDLPSMDNDLIRRGKPATHAKFGEWKAILTGDALLVASFEELMKIDAPQIRKIHHLFTWATGARGLINGQYMDLMAKGKLGLKETLLVHELKTGRLIQVATLGSYYLSDRSPSLRGVTDFLRLGRAIGISFQLFDDLNELAVDELTEHEKEINPFYLSGLAALNELQKSIKQIKYITAQYQLEHTEKMLNEYFKTNQSNLLDKISLLDKHLPSQGALLKSWLTNFF